MAQAAHANPLYLAYTNNWDFDAGEGEDDARVGDPDRQPGRASRRRSARCARSTASSSRRPRAELADAAARADRTGMFKCPHTGVALAALEKLAARGDDRQGQRVVVISTASGLKFTDFKVGYHTSARSPTSRRGYATRRSSCPNDYDAVRRAHRRHMPEA